jgi:hypothetical protein
LPPIFFHCHRGTAGLVRDSKYIQDGSVGTRGNASGQDIEVIGGQYAGDSGKETSLVARYNHEFAELTNREMTVLTDQVAIFQAPHQFEMERQICFWSYKKVPIRHLFGKRAHLISGHALR